ncbi:MAG: RIP metalloprotease RseP [Gammaproteobacteria bacterium]|nr:RIP metalloprotease RseP [Gammaproteobacteria bacterium]MBU2545892.1 RIP metalloprotease RseP [Gammaproteobacteria bacterium]
MIYFFTTLFAFFITVSIVIGVHETAHFIAARIFKIKVLRFSIGFGKVLFRWRSNNETEYVISAIPLGGYIKLLDDREDPVTEEMRPFAFNHQALFKRCIVIFAGPFSNFLFAILTYWIVFAVGFQINLPVIGKVISNSIAQQAQLKAKQQITTIDHTPIQDWTHANAAIFLRLGDKGVMEITTRQNNRIQQHTLSLNQWRLNDLEPNALQSLGIIPIQALSSVVIDRLENMPYANTAQLKRNDEILRINKHSINNWNDLTNFIHRHPDQRVDVLIKRDNISITVSAKIGHRYRWGIIKTGALGIAPKTPLEPLFPEFIQFVKYPTLSALKRAMIETHRYNMLNLHMFEKLLTGKLSVRLLAGPIAIFTNAGSALNAGWIVFLRFLAFISLSIGMINLFPLPGLDGGQLLYLCIEGLTKKSLPTSAQIILYRLSMIFILVLLGLTVVYDVLRIIS